MFNKRNFMKCYCVTRSRSIRGCFEPTQSVTGKALCGPNPENHRPHISRHDFGHCYANCTDKRIAFILSWPCSSGCFSTLMLPYTFTFILTTDPSSLYASGRGIELRNWSSGWYRIPPCAYAKKAEPDSFATHHKRMWRHWPVQPENGSRNGFGEGVKYRLKDNKTVRYPTMRQKSQRLLPNYQPKRESQPRDCSCVELRGAAFSPLLPPADCPPGFPARVGRLGNPSGPPPLVSIREAWADGASATCPSPPPTTPSSWSCWRGVLHSRRRIMATTSATLVFVRRRKAVPGAMRKAAAYPTAFTHQLRPSTSWIMT